MEPAVRPVHPQSVERRSAETPDGGTDRLGLSVFSDNMRNSVKTKSDPLDGPRVDRFLHASSFHT